MLKLRVGRVDTFSAVKYQIQSAFLRALETLSTESDVPQKTYFSVLF